ncbi:MAG TPA: Shedu anti-phage system protein SduA domain-containing protein [Solirubrobacteraceae bacterium]|jgi:hypothetical protein
MQLDLEWPVTLRHRKGAEDRLCGIDVFHDFDWRSVFSDERTQFRNGKCLAKLVQDRCPTGKTPALLLTLRDGERQGLRQTDNFAVFVVHLAEYRSSDGDAAMSYLAAHLDVDITDIEELQRIAAATDPALLQTFIESQLDISHIADWALDNEGRVQALRQLAEGDGAEPGSLADTLAALGEVEHLSIEDIRALADFLGTASSREKLLEVARAVTADPTGRYVTGEVFAERTLQRVQDAREAVAAYEALLNDGASTETVMQKFIEEHPWLLGLDYATVRPRQGGPSGAADFLLDRFDGFQDLLELKSPQDEIIRAPDHEPGTAAPAPHEYALSRTLAQALAQAMVYRDRLTRFADAAEELYGLPHARDPRLIIVLGRVDALPEHRRHVLSELNKSLHRIEVVPYDVLARRAKATLDNVERYLGEPTSD